MGISAHQTASKKLTQKLTCQEGAGRKSRLAERLKNNKDKAVTGNMLSQWKTRGYIDALPNGRFKKLPQKHDK